MFGILREKNPELTGERRRTVLKPPQVAREGTKKTVFTNFMDLCKVGVVLGCIPGMLKDGGCGGPCEGAKRLVKERLCRSETLLLPSCKLPPAGAPDRAQPHRSHGRRQRHMPDGQTRRPATPRP